MGTRRRNTNLQSAKDAAQYDVFQRELDRALEGYNSVYNRINMSMVVVGVLLGFVFMGSDKTGFRGAMDTLQTHGSLWADVAGWLYVASVFSYVVALCRLLYNASHRPNFSEEDDSGERLNLTEHALRKKEIERCRDAAKFYRSAAKDLLLACSRTNIFIGIGVVCYTVAEFLFVPA